MAKTGASRKTPIRDVLSSPWYRIDSEKVLFSLVDLDAPANREDPVPQVTSLQPLFCIGNWNLLIINVIGIRGDYGMVEEA